MTEWGDYLFEYRHNGATWGFTIRAQSQEDARARMTALNLGGKFVGGPAIMVPVPGGSIIARLIEWFKR